MFQHSDPGNKSAPIRNLMDRLRFFGPNREHTKLVSPTGHVFVIGKTANFNTVNLDWDGTNWNLIDTNAAGFVVGYANNGTISTWTAPAAPNPATLVGPSILMTGADGGWVNFSGYAANWGVYNAGSYLPQYRKHPDGMVELRGLVMKSAAAAAPDTICTFPAGVRPGVGASGDRIVPQMYNSTGAAMDIRFAPSGILYVQAPNGWPGGVGHWISFEYTYYAEG